MTAKEISREMMFAEIIAERDNIILTQHQQIEAMQKQIEIMRAEIEKLKAPKEG